VNEERENIIGKEPLSYDGIRKLGYLDQVLKETLRINPPLIQVMRKVRLTFLSPYQIGFLEANLTFV